MTTVRSRTHPATDDRPARFASLRGPGRQARWQRARLRRVAAAALMVLAVSATWVAFRPAAAQSVPVTVAARAIPAGTRITQADLKSERWPAGVPLPGLLRPAEAVGRIATGAVAAGEPVTRTRAARSTWAVLRPDEQAFTVPLADPAVVGLTTPGDLLDLYDPADRRLVASAARVVMSATSKVEPTGGASAASGVLVVAVPRQNSAELAGSLASAATSGSGLVVAARPRP